jgi:anti-sigma B factor antagonist
MKLDIRKSGDVTIIGVAGTITMLETPTPLKDQIISLVKEGERNVILSLGQLTFVDSSCMGELVSCYVRVARAGGTLKLAQAPRRVQELLLVTRLGEIFESYETDTAAIASFAPPHELKRDKEH